jgi:hypothetical protein
VNKLAETNFLPADGLILKLGHPGQVAIGGDAAEDPRELGMLGDGRLHEEDRSLRVDTAGDQVECHVARCSTQHLRIDVDRDRVIVDDAIDTLIVVLEGGPVSDRPKVVPDV